MERTEWPVPVPLKKTRRPNLLPDDPESRIHAADRPDRTRPSAADRCRFTLVDDRGMHTVDAGLAKRIEGNTTMTGNKLHHEYQPDVMRVVAGGEWRDANTFAMTWVFVESAFVDTVVCRFDGDRLVFERSVNVNSGPRVRPPVRGRVQTGT